MDATTMIIRDALDYEIQSAVWPGFISWPWAQTLASRYFTWKVRRKWARYQQSLAIAAELKREYPEIFGHE